MKNWKTTLAGALGAGFIALTALLQTGVVDAKTMAIAFAVAVIGAVSKDFNVSGTGK